MKNIIISILAAILLYKYNFIIAPENEIFLAIATFTILIFTIIASFEKFLYNNN